MKKTSVTIPKIGEFIMVNHEDRGGVYMEVFEIHDGFLSCEFEGVEFCVVLHKIFNGEWFERWEAVKWKR